jgi:1-deoxy-D-xylulose-5-phosphate reductoisomerase
MTTRSVTVLGSTGSVGCNTLDLIEKNSERFSIVALTANKSVDQLINQARRFRPGIAVIGDEALLPALKDGLVGTGVKAAGGAAAIVEAAEVDSDWVMGGIVGAAGLRPTLAAVRRGAIIGLANKECLVCAGDIVMAEVERSGATLLPVDSEHNAIFQVFDFDHQESITRIILTASGGPFRTKSRDDMRDVSPEQAVAHPNWDMGAKISVDSATMMNKGLELIEAFHLFPLDEPAIDILVHPQSVVHSMVEYEDGSVLAQMGSPDMRTPISYALNWPQRMKAPVKRLDLASIGSLTFEAPDPERFPALRLAREALRAGGPMPTILNAANEVAVHNFLQRKIGFLDICRLVEETLDGATQSEPGCLEDIDEIDTEARRKAEEIAARLH